jgi:hypothetical protein
VEQREKLPTYALNTLSTTARLADERTLRQRSLLQGTIPEMYSVVQDLLIFSLLLGRAVEQCPDLLHPLT